MTVNKRSKNSRQRGSWTHGWGSKKKHRGAGHRGGRGKAGTGKRGDANKPRIWKNKRYFGKFGFKAGSPKVEIKAVNLAYINNNINSLVNKKLAEFKDGVYVVDISKLGYDKLLSKGLINKKFRVICSSASKGAKEKVEAAGGSLVMPEAEKEEK